MKKDDNERLPLFKSWKAWYLAVILFLVLQIIFFYYFTKYFS